MLKHSVYAAWCESQLGLPYSLISLRVAVGEPVWLRSSDSLDSIPTVLDEAQHKSCEGYVVLACVPYEAAPAFDSALKVSTAGVATTTVMGFAPDQVLSWAEFVQSKMEASCADSARLRWTPWMNEHDQSWFDESFDCVREWIASGDFYQINLTTRLRSTASIKDQGAESSDCALFELFIRLFEAQPAAFSMFLRLPQHSSDRSIGRTTEQTILSLSPELFFTWDKGRIVTSPMKGTRKPNDLSPRLADSSKDRAENLMIVDLLRNDLARVCLPRTVQAESLFDVLTLPSVEQMTSTISGLTQPDIKVSELFGALFPCGSVTGAPKAQSMKRIAQLETSPRGVYCGALGLLKPDGSMRFSVPIRTLLATRSAKGIENLEISKEIGSTGFDVSRFDFEYGVGSGLTWYSNKLDEQKEWWQKTVFLRDETLDFDILETVRLENREWQNLELHLQRMKNSARYFSYVWNESQIRANLMQLALAAPPDAQSSKQVEVDRAYRGRWLLSADGNFEVQLFPLDGPPAEKVRLLLADRPLEEALQKGGDRGNKELIDFSTFIHHKTTYRPHYDAFSTESEVAFDTLLYNRDGYLTETCRFNLVLKVGALYLTPAISKHDGFNNGVNNSAKLLNGVLRQRLLSENRIQEYPLHIGDLARADEVWLINSLRGWVRVDEIVNQDFNQKGAVIFPQRHS
jgi:para-aminobenzoate synthetase / 4-amino-4-deoxychorismate lyase